MYVYYNPNPNGARANDCTVRAISKATGQTWTDVYVGLCLKGYDLKDMPASNAVWSAYLLGRGFKRYSLGNSCPDCYTVKDFAGDHADGVYVLGTGTHAVAIIDGDYYDSWDSGDEIPMYYFRR